MPMILHTFAPATAEWNACRTRFITVEIDGARGRQSRRLRSPAKHGSPNPDDTGPPSRMGFS
jgi:hypothetical protein